MSKASEWALRREAAVRHLQTVERDECPNLFFPDGSGHPAVWIDTDGRPVFERIKGKFEVADALTLGLWLLDVLHECLSDGQDPGICTHCGIEVALHP